MTETTETSETTTGATNGVADAREALYGAFDAARPVLAAARHADPSLRTPCPEYDVGELLEHLHSVGNRIAAMGRGRPASEVPDIPPPTDGRYEDAWDVQAAEVRAVWSALEPDAEIVVPWRAMTAAEASAIYAAEVVLHAWDIAVATGVPIAVRDDVAEAGITGLATEAPPETRAELFAMIKQQMPDDFEWSDPFGAAVEVPADASPLDRLVAISGRSPGWPDRT